MQIRKKFVCHKTYKNRRKALHGPPGWLRIALVDRSYLMTGAFIQFFFYEVISKFKLFLLTGSSYRYFPFDGMDGS